MNDDAKVVVVLIGACMGVLLALISGVSMYNQEELRTMAARTLACKQACAEDGVRSCSVDKCECR